MSVSGSAAQFTLHERLAGARRVVVDRVRDELLAGAGLAADEDGRGARRRLRDLLVQLLHRPAVADDVLQLVAALQLALELRVLVEKPPALGLDEALDAESLPEEGRDDREERRRALEIPCGVVGKQEGEDADRPAVERDGHGHEAQFAPGRGGGRERLVAATSGAAPSRPAGRRPACRSGRRAHGGPRLASGGRPAVGPRECRPTRRGGDRRTPRRGASRRRPRRHRHS